MRGRSTDERAQKSRRVTGAAAVFACAVLSLALYAGCGSDTRDLFVVQFDAGAEAEAGRGDGGLPSVDPTIGEPCTEDPQCDDAIPCTFDRCDTSIGRCRNTPDDTHCDDGLYCNGAEKCVLRQGCVPGPVVTCEDGNGCTIDRCAEASKQCEHAARDVDGDGDPDNHCVAGADCDDTDPTVSSKLAEICDNFKDDNCNGEIDEEPCATAKNDDCSTALAVTAPGTFFLSTIAAKKDYAERCSVPRPAAGKDLVVAITVPAGGAAKDVFVRAATHSPNNDVALALETSCGGSSSELECGFIATADEARAIARSVAAGGTVYAIVTTQSESAVDVQVQMPDATTKPANETCAAPQPITVGAPFTVSLIDASTDLASACRTGTGELTYSFTLAEPQDVRIFASTLDGVGDPVVSLRADDCTTESRCGNGGTPPLFARALPAGVHVLSVTGTSQLDASVIVETSPSTAAPQNQTCTSPPALVPGQPTIVDLSTNESAIKDGCSSTGPDAAYALDLGTASDVLLLDFLPGGDTGALSFDLVGCTTNDVLDCTTGGGSAPVRVSKRNVTAGSYRVVVADQKGLTSQLTALVRPAVAPVSVTTGDTCDDPMTIPETGGFFTGDTSLATPTFGAGCDSTGEPANGAKDQIMQLTLTQRRRVIFDMSLSGYSTLLDLRSGPTCPGIELPDACSPGLSAGRSYLDLTLDPGTYWVQIDGFGGQDGPWALDVRTLPP